MDDSDAWALYPHHRLWFDKLWLSEKLGHLCGPCGVAPKVSQKYIVRPIYNLSGMGVGSRYRYIRANDCTQVPPGYFWQEFFSGDHYSITYRQEKGRWEQESCFRGFNSSTDLTKFSRWRRSNLTIKLPPIMDALLDVDIINVEFKGDKIIEVHLRGTPDPDYDEIIPVWGDTDVDHYTQEGYQYIDSYDDADGFLLKPRMGFMVK